jgi:hypothetical protein
LKVLADSILIPPGRLDERVDSRRHVGFRSDWREGRRVGERPESRETLALQHVWQHEIHAAARGMTTHVDERQERRREKEAP